jgi:hypothetical protein
MLAKGMIIFISSGNIRNDEDEMRRFGGLKNQDTTLIAPGGSGGTLEVEML